MVDYDILRQCKSDETAIRLLFTAEKGSALWDAREAWEKRLDSRIREGVRVGVTNYHFIAAADLAWDGNLVTRELVPLQLYAQGKIDLGACAEMLNGINPETAAKFITKDPETKKITGVSIPDFHKVVIGLARSFVTRRVSSIATRYVRTFPFWEYEPMSTSFVAKLRGDALSQRVESIVNSYGYRHDLVQAIREMLIYPYQMEFVRGAWDVNRTWRKAKNPAGVAPVDGQLSVEARIEKEGVLFSRPHPTRSFWDTSAPLSALNSDTGPQYCGYYNVVRFDSVSKSPGFFNTNVLTYSRPLVEMLNSAAGFRELYFPNAPITFPDTSASFGAAEKNAYDQSFGLYDSEKGDQSVVLVEYFEKVVPKEVGLGDYPYPVWVRLVVSGRTVVFGEVLPSSPGVVYQYNSHDGRLMNNSFMHDSLAYQDQMSNMLTNLLLAQKAALIKIIALDIELVKDPVLIQKIRDVVAGASLYAGPLLVEHRGTVSGEMGLNHGEAIKLSQSESGLDVTRWFQSIIQLLSIAERMLGTSANEGAQSEPREVSASETVNIAQTVATSTAFMSLGVDEAIDAKKRIVYESLIACGSKDVVVPIVNRYTKGTIEKAGFTVVQEDAESTASTNLTDPKSQTIMGSKDALIYNYTFTSRDGSERPSSPKSAEVLVQLITQLSQVPGFLQELGKERLFAFINEVIRLSGCGVDAYFDVKEGESDQIPPADSAQGTPTGSIPNTNPSPLLTEQFVQKLAQAVMEQKQRMDAAGVPQVGAQPPIPA